jgi:hypothetical protein
VSKFLEYDVVVAGGGTAGAAAAVAAARRGHRVLLIEEQNCLGGVSTAGAVCWWFASLDGLGDIFDRVRSEMRRQGGLFINPGHFNPEHLKFVWQQLAEEAGVRLLLHASVSAAESGGGKVTSLEALSCSQRIAVKARYFIDATGEGDLGALAGAEFMKGEAESGLTLHMTLTAWLYDTGRPVASFLPDGLQPIRDDSELPGLGGGYLVDDRRVFLNSTKVIGHDPTDPFSLTDAECEARSQLFQIVHYMQRTQFPTYALGGTGAIIGIREGRRIVGDYVLNRDDILPPRGPTPFEDGVAVATSQVDFHSLTRQGGGGWGVEVPPYAIPLRSLVAKGFRNLLMAGKCISADQTVHCSCRMTPTCCAMGQAAGTAAALAVESGAADIREVPVSGLRTVLAGAGMELDPSRHRAFCTTLRTLDKGDIPPA